MTDQNYDDVKKVLKAAMSPLDSEMPRDLWPQMLRRMDRRSFSIPLLDWILLAVAVVFLALVPAAIPLLLYQL